MKKIIEAIKAFFSPKSPATYAEVKKEAIEAIYKLEPTVVEEEAPKKAPAKKKAKKKPAKKRKQMNLSSLKGHVPDKVIDQIPGIQEKFGLTTGLRLAHFLAQAGHESGGFRVTNENLNYSAKGLQGIFKKYFPSEAIALDYAKKPQKIANRVYGGRMGNGNEASGDGFKFRGRGYIQLTGRDNYTAFGKSIGKPIEETPDLVATEYALASAAWFWSKNGLNKIADTGATDAAVTMITKRVNGGTIGLADRIKHFKEFYSLLK